MELAFVKAASWHNVSGSCSDINSGRATPLISYYDAPIVATMSRSSPHFIGEDRTLGVSYALVWLSFSCGSGEETFFYSFSSQISERQSHLQMSFRANARLRSWAWSTRSIKCTCRNATHLQAELWGRELLTERGGAFGASWMPTFPWSHSYRSIHRHSTGAPECS
jgi:hypothetical protein